MTKKRCSYKIAYNSEEEAVVNASMCLRKKSCRTFVLRAYKCPDCEKWHLTKRV
jgi:hypothetical protein